MIFMEDLHLTGIMVITVRSIHLRALHYPEYNDGENGTPTEDDIPSDETKIIEYEPVESLEPDFT